MKSLFVILSLWTTVSFAGSIQECTQVINMNADILRSYTDLYKSCRQNPNSPVYPKYQRLARKFERLAEQTQAQCFKACEGLEDIQDYCPIVPIMNEVRACP